MRYTLTEALVKLKITEKKIGDTIPTLPVAFVCTGTNKIPNGYKSTEDFRAEIKKQLQSAQDLIGLRQKLKDNIVLANATTKVKIGSKEMTIAEAIEQKKSVASRKDLLTVLKTQLVRAESQVQVANQGLEVKADNYLVQMFSAQPNATEALKKEARASYVENNKAFAVTDDSLKSYITKLEEDISEFETNVDVALSVVNAKTEIEI